MKKFINIILASAFAALTVLSCAQKETPYEPGKADPSDCYGVFFPSQDAMGSHTYDPSMDKTVSITVTRTNTNGAITVPFTTTVSDEGVFNFGTIAFADGQSETELDVTFPNAPEGKTLSFSVQLEDDNAYVSHYNTGAVAMDFSVLIVTWETFLDPKTKEPAVITLNEGWWGEVHEAQLKYYEVDGIRTCILSSIEEGNGIWGDTVDATLEFTWYTKNNNKAGYNFLEVKKQYFGFDYSDWTSKPVNEAVNPIYVYDYPWYWIQRGEVWGVNGMGADWLDEANLTGQIDGSYPVGYYDGNGGFYFNLRYYIPGLGGFSPDPYEFVAIASGFVRTDYSLILETDYSVDGVTPVYVVAGADVASIKYAVYEGELNSAQVAAKLEAIVAGTEPTETYEEFEFDEETAKNYGAFGIAPETSGAFTILAVACDATGAVQNDGSIVVNHISAADTEENLVNISVFTEPTPARYAGLTEYNSFAYGIVGNDIEEVHVGILPANKLTPAVLEVIKADEKGNYTLPKDALDSVNALGGFYDVVTGLDPGTSYAVVVWATNGALDTTVYDVFTTTPSPEVWETVGTVDWTDVFFGPWFSADPVTYTVELQASQDVEGRYRLVNVYGEAFPYNEPGDWDDSKDYYLVINADDPDYVWMEVYDTGCNWGYGDFLLTSDAGAYVANGYDIETVKANAEAAGILFGKKEGNVITFPAGCLLKAMANYNNGSWYYGNRDEEYTVTLNLNEGGNSAPAVKKSADKAFSGKGVVAPAHKLSKIVFERDPKPVKVSVDIPAIRKEKASAKNFGKPVQETR